MTSGDREAAPPAARTEQKPHPFQSALIRPRRLHRCSFSLKVETEEVDPVFSQMKSHPMTLLLTLLLWSLWFLLLGRFDHGVRLLNERDLVVLPVLESQVLIEDRLPAWLLLVQVRLSWE